MKISALHVDGFGAWHDLTLSDLSKGATVFYGPNEAGKTTLLNLIRTVLYGFSEKRCSRYLPPARGGQPGGSLTVSDMNGEYLVTRSAPAHFRGGAGNLAVASPNGDKHANELLTTLLAGVDETIFNNVFAVGLTQMQQLATLSDTEAAKQLYGLATGVDRVSLFDVTQELQTQRDCILATQNPRSGSPPDSGVLDRMLDQKGRLQKELKALRRDEGHYAKLRREQRELDREIKDKENAKRLLDRNGDWSELSATIRKRWVDCQQINSRLTRIGPVADLPQHVASRVTSISKQVKQRRAEWEKLRDQRRKVKGKAVKLRGRDTLYQHAAEIEALDRQRSRFLSLEEDVNRARTTVEELEFEMQSEMEELGLQTGTSAKRLPPISDQIIDALREPARETRELRESAEALKKLAEERRKDAARVKTKLETAAVRFGSEDIGRMIAKGVALVENLERRIQLDEHRESIVRELEELEADSSYWQQRGVLPWRGVLAVCGLFSAGAMLLITGILNSWFTLPDTTRLPMMLIGGSLAVVSLVIKGAFEHSAEERATFCRQQIRALHEEQAQARQESEEVDQMIPSGGGPLDQQLVNARKEIAQLDQFLPLSQQHQQLEREAAAADHQATETVRQLKDARRVWKASLRTVGLPESLTPAQIGQMTGRVGEVTRLRNRVTEAKKELADRQQELDTIRDRIDQLFVIGEIIDRPEGLAAQLARLLTELEKHAKSGKQREELRQQFEAMAEEQSRIAKAAQLLCRTRQQLLQAHGITSMRDFQDTRVRSAKAAQLRRDRDTALGEISGLAGEEFTVSRLQKMLDQRSKALVESLTAIDRDRETIDTDLHRLKERRSRIQVKLEGQLQDRRSEQKELAIQVLDEKLREAAKQWQRISLMLSVLDRVKRDYETKRQPVALAEASRHLERLTEERYTRIWTPMDQSSLCVDDRHGTALPVEKLSRGTRELVFLALRLALVSSYSRRGANMPVVLDDVFVNFDDQRAAAATAVLADLADSGQQMLIFTCHQRIRDTFLDLGADVRDLPSRTGVAAPAKLVEPPAIEKTEATHLTNQEKATAAVVAEQPIYDAESWNEMEEKPSVKQLQAAPNSEDNADLSIEEDTQDPSPPPVRNVRQISPTWRDEWLEPLPDLADE